ncbi:MAG TPA: hypothetical protein VNZ66_01370 [Aeromicrobium sp.]|nr:hypothetical protein [Aeromicrobium sp.]
MNDTRIELLSAATQSRRRWILSSLLVLAVMVGVSTALVGAALQLS